MSLNHWTYTFQGRAGEPLADLTEQDKPSPVITSERPDEIGMCDLWLLADVDHNHRRAVYGWKAEGTAEEIVLTLADQFGIPRAEVAL